MIGLIIAALRARPAQALTVALLAAFVTASAVAVPVYLAAADRTVISNEWNASTLGERSIGVATSVDLSNERDRTFESTVPAQVAGDGFTAVFSAETDLAFPGKDIYPRLVFRENVCAHLVLVAGRCPVGSGEIMVGQATARVLGVSVGQAVPMQNAAPLPSDGGGQASGFGPNPAEPPMTVSVVGVFRVPQPDEDYWASQDYFATGTPFRHTAEPVFTTRGTLEALGHPKEPQFVDAVLDRSAVRAGTLAAVRAAVAARQAKRADATTTTSRIPALLDRIDRDRAALRQVVPLAAIPLLGFGWFLLYFAVAYAAADRRGEIGVVKMRGTGRVRRWVLALGDNALAVLAGSAIAVVAGFVVDGAIWWYAPVALAGGLLAVVLAGRGAFTGPVVELLRQVPSRASRWRAATAEGVLVALAVAAIVQLRSATGPLTGIMLLAPGLVVLAVALLAARLVVPIAAGTGHRAVRRGWLAPGLGALQLARRPGGARLLTIVVVALAELVFATGAADVAAQARSTRVSVALGAPQVLTVGATPVARLLAAVRKVDPQGRYAMAVATVPGASENDPPILAVDAPRLPHVVDWGSGYGPLSAAQVAARLHPASSAPVLINGQEAQLDLTATGVDPAANLHLFAEVITVDDTFEQLADFGQLRSGRQRYEATMTRCLYSCRLIGLRVTSSGEAGAGTASLVLHGLTVGTNATPVDAGFGRSGRWRTPQATGDAPSISLAAGTAGLTLTLQGPVTIDNGRIAPVDTPYPLPAVSTAALPRPALGRLGDTSLAVARAGAAGVLPGLGRSGILVDLEYADRMAASTADASGGAVWLSSDAPADIRDRLAAAGLSVLDSQSAAHDARYLSRQGPGEGLRYHLIAAVLALLLAIGGLALVAAVDRRRGAELWALRAQGLPARTIARATLITYTTLVFASVLVAPVAAAAAWWATGARVPIFADGQSVVPPPAWPNPAAVLPPWLVGGAVLVVAGVVIALRISLRRRGRS